MDFVEPIVSPIYCKHIRSMGQRQHANGEKYDFCSWLHHPAVTSMHQPRTCLIGRPFSCSSLVTPKDRDCQQRGSMHVSGNQSPSLRRKRYVITHMSSILSTCSSCSPQFFSENLRWLTQHTFTARGRDAVGSGSRLNAFQVLRVFWAVMWAMISIWQQGMICILLKCSRGTVSTVINNQQAVGTLPLWSIGGTVSECCPIKRQLGLI